MRCLAFCKRLSIYIPCKEKKDWGSQTQSRQYYEIRNHEICEKHKNGTSVVELAAEYSLSQKSIQRIIRTTNLVIERKKQ